MKIPVSVVIPAYQAERYIGEAIESILSQTYQPEEIVVVNDGSTDGTSDILKKYPSVRVVDNEQNMGLSATLNNGINASKMPWIGFLDADDLWAPRKLETQWKAILEKGETAGEYLFFTHVEQFISPDLSDFEKQKIDLKHPIVPGVFKITMLVSRRAFERVGFFDTKWKIGDFVDWYARAKERKLKEVMLPDVLARRRLHLSNMSRQSNDDRAMFAKIMLASIKRRRNETTDQSK